MSLLHKRIRLVCLLIIVALMLASIGVTYGRYQSTIRDMVLFQAQHSDPNRSVSIHSDSGWTTTDHGTTLAFSLKSGTEGQHALLRLTATEGFSTQNAVVTLTVDGTDYVGIPQLIDDGHPLFDKMGRGAEYRFYSADSECEWMVDAAIAYKLTIEGSADASLLRLTATEV